MSKNGPDSPPDRDESDEAAIRELLDRQVAGWDAGDPEAYAAVFTRDADYVTFLGHHYKGREAIAATYAPLFAKLLRGSRLHTEIIGLRFLTPSVALIRANAAASQNTTHRRLADKPMQELAGSSSSSRHR
ncbi:SgcJ/EcaC family oxidoreductase [Mycolicibacter senuensis]|uniref:SnoaL-like domain-containing protein n=1 Tax=Mycolicibacter senuensis TaxID=386913 RepID=A0A7I9XEM7_9MYCO|nr:SgcJ/EcaC family oxidoreductase [Mycolicibacter senuensis]MDQ2627474.1 SgcJ/EcaC family oxidoreductase [Actinomycetota bacterium]GFG68425.1 hypothetical protein MSEN_01450 [Mycolicibacter senuensis]